MSAIGRISGPLLKSNLIRNGIDLAFETDLLYLDVNNQRIGIKTTTPQYELDVNGTSRTTNLIVTNRADIGDVNIVGNTISSDGQYLNLGTLDNVVYNNKLRVDSIDIEGNVISTNSSNANLELRPNGTGVVEVYSDMNVTGNIHATGNITADGSITLGDADTDNIVFNAEVASDILPNLDDVYTLGTGGTQYILNTDFVLGATSIVVSGGTGTWNLPAAGPAWVDDITAQAVGFTFLIALEGTSGTLHKVTTTGSFSGTNPQQVTVTAPSIFDGTYNVVQINLNAKRWADVWVDNLATNGVNTGTLIVDGVDLTLRQGNIYYVAENGSDLNTGTHQQDPFSSVEKALSVAASGDAVWIYPGVYSENFPLEVPTGVTVVGHGIRAVKLVPTTNTRYHDAFHLNGETTVSNLTIANFFSGGDFFEVTSSSAGSTTVNVGTAPFAHTYVTGGSITINGTEYVITGATYTHTTGVLTVTHSAGVTATPGTDVFVSGLEFSCNGGTRIFPDNGYAFKFATDFEVTSRSPYIKDITVITAGTTTTVEDPRGFNAGDAGKGAYIDGAYATANSKEASMLFHSATFITPGVDAITATNGARIEWLNSFTYFANRSMYAYDSNDGLKGAGKTRIRLDGITGTAPAAGQTVTFTSTDSSTVVGPLTISSVENSDTILIDGKNIDLIGFDTTPASITFSGGGSATSIQNLDLRDFGAEIRLIGSASVYGNFGLVGDGPGVLMYAIGHNLAYIGNGKEVTNDPSTVIQANEVVVANDAQIRYNSVDHKGDFRVGDLFYVNQETGAASFSVSDFIINTTGGVTFTTGSDTTFVDGTKIETGDWRISGNTIETLTQDANFTAASGQINLQDNVDITGNLDVTGNVTIGGNIVIGDEATDTIQIVAGIDSDIIPRVDSTWSLGTSTKTWSNLYVNQINVDGLRIRDNYIESIDSNANLELRANGTGVILIPSNNVQIDNNLTVDGTTTLANTNITGTVTLVGDFNQTGSYTLTDNLTVGQNLTVGAAAQFEEILIDDNTITTTSSNTNLELRAAGTGDILVPTNNVNITNDLTVVGDVAADNIDVVGNLTANDANIGDIQISGNVIETTVLDTDLELRASGTGDIVVPTNDVSLGQNLTVSGNTSLQNTSITGLVTHVGDSVQTGNVTLLGEWTNGNIKIEDNFVTTTASNSDLELRASGTGVILVPSNDVQINNDLTVSGDTDLQNTAVTGTITHVGDATQTGVYTITGSWTNGDLEFNDNVIQTTATNSNLELRANGSGVILVPSNNVTFSQSLTVNGSTDLQNTLVTGTITHVGNVVQTGNFEIAGTISTGNIEIAGNVIETTNSNSDLELRASGTGNILVPNNNVQITNDLTVSGTTNLSNTSITGTLVHAGDTVQTGNVTLSGDWTNGNILINDNFITTTESNSDLELRANGTGTVSVPSNDVELGQSLTVSGLTTLDNTTINGVLTHVGDTTQTGNFSIVGQFTNGVLSIDSNVITTTLSNADLELRANGTGEVLIPDNNVTADNNLTVNGDTSLQSVSVVGDITQTGNVSQTGNFDLDGNLSVTGNIDISGGIQLENIRIVGNVVETTLSNSDLELRANGTGQILIPNDDVTVSNNLTVVGTLTVGDIVSTGQIQANRFFTGDILVDDNFITTTTSNSDLELRTSGTGSVVIDDFDINNSTISSSGDITLAPGSDLLIIDSTGSLKLPSGTTAERPAGVAGQIRYNSELARFEGFNGTSWINLKGVEDLDGNTRVTAELTEGSNDNVIRFDVAGSTIVDIDSTRLSAPRAIIDNIVIDGNVISTTVTNTDLILGANGTGSVRLDNLAFRDNNITNIVSNAVTVISSTDNGYVKFDTTYGMVLPVGTSVQRPPIAFTEEGMMRYNSDDGRVEIYDGANWVSVAGSQSGITRAEAEDIALQIVLSLG